MSILTRTPEPSAGVRVALGAPNERPLIPSGKPQCGVDNIDVGLSSCLTTELHCSIGQRATTPVLTAARQSAHIGRMAGANAVMIAGDTITTEDDRYYASSEFPIRIDSVLSYQD